VSQTKPFANSPELRKVYLEAYEFGFSMGAKGDEITCPHDMAPPDKQAPLVQGFYSGQYDGLKEFRKKQKTK
jgi:hypothetical protein